MNKKLILTALFMPTVVLPCILKVLNDSKGYKYIYLVANKKIPAVVSQADLENEQNVVRISKGQAKGIASMWFYVYTPRKNGQFERAEYVKAGYCDSEINNKMTYKQIVTETINMKRFKVDHLKKKKFQQEQKDVDAGKMIEKDMPEQPGLSAYKKYPGGFLP